MYAYGFSLAMYLLDYDYANPTTSIQSKFLNFKNDFVMNFLNYLPISKNSVSRYVHFGLFYKYFLSAWLFRRILRNVSREGESESKEKVLGA